MKNCSSIFVWLNLLGDVVIVFTDEKRHNKQNNVRSVWTTRQNQLNQIQMLKSRHSTACEYVYYTLESATSTSLRVFSLYAMCVPRALSLSRNVLASVMCITAACASFTRFIRYWENKNSSWLSSYQLRENTRDRSYLGDQCLTLNAYETIWKDHETGIWMNFHEQWNILLDTQKPDDNYSS